MIFQILLFFAILLILYIIRGKISTTIYLLSFLLTKNKKVSIAILSFILLPGTIVHELSHFFAATMLRVQTGKITVFPYIGKDGQAKAGSVAIGETDVFRRSLIGISPVIIGIILIYIVTKIFFPGFSLLQPATYQPAQASNLPAQGWPALGGQPTTFLGLYLLFSLSVTMFSSKKDMESFWIAFPIIFLFLLSAHIVGIRIFLAPDLSGKMETILTEITIIISLCALINAVIYLLFSALLHAFEKLLGEKVGIKAN